MAGQGVALQPESAAGASSPFGWREAECPWWASRLAKLTVRDGFHTLATVITAESYTLGYDNVAVSFVGARRARTHAAFALPRLQPGMRLLDCGCGPGTISLDFARMVAPGEVIGIDREESQLELARAAARAQGVQNVRFEAASIYSLPYDDESFEGVFAHALFEHLKEPARALAELRRVLKPGGFAALRSPDWGGFLITPETPAIREAVDYFKFLQHQHGGDTEVGRKLKGLLAGAGFTRHTPSGAYEFCEPLSYMTDVLIARIENSLVRDDAVARGWMTEARARELVAGVREFSQRPDGVFAIAWCEIIGVK